MELRAGFRKKHEGGGGSSPAIKIFLPKKHAFLWVGDIVGKGPKLYCRSLKRAADEGKGVCSPNYEGY